MGWSSHLRPESMEISFTVRRGSDDQPLTFSFLAPAVQAALRRGLQAAAQRAQQRSTVTGEQGSAEGRGASSGAPSVFSAAAPAAEGATSSTADTSASSTEAAGASSSGATPASAAATAAAAAATGMPQPDLTRMIERIHRLSGAVAGSIFRESCRVEPQLTPCAFSAPGPAPHPAQRTSSPAPFGRVTRAPHRRAIGRSMHSCARPRRPTGSAPCA